MTLDLSLIKHGAKLHTRGGSVLVCGENASADRSQIYGGYNETWYINGAYLAGEPNHPMDIIRIEPAPEPRTIIEYLNVYEGRFGNYYPTLEEAKENRGHNYIDCLEINYTVGQGATVRSVL